MYQRILVPFDGSSPSVLGLEEAIKLAKLTGAKLRVVYEIDELIGATGFESYAIYAADVLTAMRRNGKEILDDARARVKSAGLDAETEIFESHGHQLADMVVKQAAAWRADLIVIGSHGRRGAARMFMGSDAEQILRLSPVPVLIVRNPASEEAKVQVHANAEHGQG